jgi:hypothetical protein
VKAKTITKAQILHRLCAIGEMGKHGLICADAIWQEDLFAIQAEFCDLLVDLADSMGKGRILADRFPFAFKVVEKPA